MQLPIVALGIQPQGPFTLEQAERYIAACRARQKRYQVLCVEAGAATKEILSKDVTFGLALKRAEKSLDIVSDALVAVGFQSNKIEIALRSRTYTTECAVAALIKRDSPNEPHFVMATSSGGTRVAAKVIADVINNWDSGAYFQVGNSGSVTEIAKTIVSKALRRA